METTNKNLVSYVIFLAFIALAIFFISRPAKITEPAHIVQNIKSVLIGGQNIQVDLALTQAQEEQGLSGRTSLAANTGMLFAFANPGKYHFWMKDMNFPIDIIWLGSDMHVVYIKADARPELYPEVYGPGPTDRQASYVLEVVSGFSQNNNLKVGDKFEFGY